MLMEEEEATRGESHHSAIFWVHSKQFCASEKLDLQTKKKLFFVLLD
jgi:hypothetical protein